MTNREKAKKWLEDNLVKSSGQREETLLDLLDEMEEEAFKRWDSELAAKDASSRAAGPASHAAMKVIGSVVKLETGDSVTFEGGLKATVAQAGTYRVTGAEGARQWRQARHLERTSEAPFLVECQALTCGDPTHFGANIGQSAEYLDAKIAAEKAGK